MSEVNTHPFDILPVGDKASLIFTPCPGTKGNSVKESLAELKAAGADSVITMMPQADLEYFGVTDIALECERMGMGWFHMPVEDDQAPEVPFLKALQAYGSILDKQLRDGKRIVVHCKGGTGRTSLIAAVLMLRQGYEWDEMVTLIHQVRPTGVRIPLHVAFLRGYQACLLTIKGGQS